MSVSLSTVLAGTDTALDIITRGLRRIRVVSLLDSPPSEIAVHALAALNDILASYENGLNYPTLTLTADTSNGSKTIVGLADSDNLYNAFSLFAGMNVSGTGIAASTRIHKIDNSDEITLDTAATASGSDVSLTFAAVPFNAAFSAALSAVLAVRLAEDFGATVGPVLARDAQYGQAELDGLLLHVPQVNVLDKALFRMPSGRYYDGVGTLGDDV